MLVIKESKIKDWLNELGKKYRVIDARETYMPPKQYFFPPKEKTFVFDKKGGRLKVPEHQEKIAVFGLNLVDLEAMTQLDEIMKKPQQDFYYWRRRNQSLLIGLTDDDFKIAPGGDVVFKKISAQEYEAMVLTKKGKEIAKGKFFRKSAPKKAKGNYSQLSELRKMLLDAELLAEAVAWSWRAEHKIWDELAEKCLGCGNCTYVCPLCHCFSFEDRVRIDDKECSRCRYWDACTLPDFAKISGGHNFHKTIKERYYNWYYHKFVRAYKEYGKAQCVGCVRCTNFCPAGIKIEEVLKRIVADYKKAVSNY